MHPPLARDPGLAGERRRFNRDVEVGFAFAVGSRPGVAAVGLRIVHNLEARRREARGQLRPDSLGISTHNFIPRNA